MQDLKVFHDDNSVFIDHSKDAKDFLRDDFAVNFVSAEDSMYIGLYKPFNAAYVEFTTPATGADLVFTINNNVLSPNDDTRDFSRSGFIEFDKPSDWVAETINGESGYWLKIDSNADFSAVFRGLNIVFSDDNDLKQEARNIDDLLAKGDTTFIAYHLASRNEIIQTLRNGGRAKKDVNDMLQNITKWDILDFGEIRQASKYLTLAKIYYDVSKNVDDKFYGKFRDYEGMFGKAFSLFYARIDQNDDGLYEQEDDLVLNNIEIELV